ncbi:Fe-S oxidoreductase [Cenarchaeum symbiosum A]|uniref:Fe-S oxidoreductase n=1 Tax=Cenarchaeum symbiosum (strain A) TaxID=414004 RepID=A0RX48_CENSY|nr:Fe-S oxidoreductase [Cenarchaeum symbiosum A]
MEIMGRGARQILRESPLYFHLGVKFAGYRLFGRKSPLYGSADIINSCNLHCVHCYWWLNRKENEELGVEEWKKIIDEKFKKNHVFVVTVVGGEPLMRPEIVELFAKEFPKRACVVTNGTWPIPRLRDIYFYWISIDGSEEVHNGIRGEGAWAKTRENVLEYVRGSDKAWKDIWITMTINSRNYKTVRTVIEDWREYSNKIGFQFHTPFIKDDPLWLPFGKERDAVIDEILDMRSGEYSDYIVNPVHQLNTMRRSWGGKGTTPVDCPTWAMLSVDHLGREKHPCCIGSADEKMLKPRCEECGLGCYSVLTGYGMKG